MQGDGRKAERLYGPTNGSATPQSAGQGIAGGMGKLLSRFIADVEPDDIMSYADIEWSDGGVYRHLGFAEDGGQGPRYFSA